MDRSSLERFYILASEWVKLFRKPILQNLRPTEVKRKEGLGEKRAMTTGFHWDCWPSAPDQKSTTPTAEDDQSQN